ncbi:MAG: hypothetical protein Q7U20_07815 [Caulobacter sp.]|nr:hypothetical protein [Caulobacter sp.]
MFRGLVFLVMIGLSVVGALLLVGGEFGGAGFCYLAFFIVWLAAGRPTSLSGASSRKRRERQHRAHKPVATQPKPAAQVLSPSINGSHGDDINGSFGRLDPQWKAWLNREASSQMGEEP